MLSQQFRDVIAAPMAHFLGHVQGRFTLVRFGVDVGFVGQQ